MVAEMAARDETSPCFLFKDVPGTLKGSRLLVNFFGGKRKNMTLGFPTHLNKFELSEGFRVHYTARPQAHPAEIRRDRPGDAERHHRRRDRRHAISGAAMARAGRRPLHRHRLLQHHARPGRRLDQLRHLPGHDPRREDRSASTSRPASMAARCATSTRRAASACRSRRLRRRSDEVPDGLQRSAVGVSEFESSAACAARPVEVIKGPVTGLPIPANAEIVIEGFVNPTTCAWRARSASGPAITPATCGPSR